MTPDRREQAGRFGGYFEAQLRLAGRLSELTGAPLGDMAYQHTNLHRRFGLGYALDAPSPVWLAYAAQLEAMPAIAEQVALTQATFEAAADEILPLPGQTGFGCFACEPPKDGVVRIHFNNRDTDADGGPLARGKIDRRRADLRALLAHIRLDHPDAATLAGKSWLYHLEAYRRLFPPAYVATRAPVAGPIHLSGTSTWGQMITSDGAIRPAMRDHLYAALPTLDPDAPWRAFALQPLAVSAPLTTFYVHFGL